MKACLLIPIFDHGARIGAVVEALARFELPCLVVDDGSGAATREVLGALEDRHAFLEVHHRKQNGGRGAALKTGYRRAAQRGFTHVLQLDADGQHDPGDVPRFDRALSFEQALHELLTQPAEGEEHAFEADRKRLLSLARAVEAAAAGKEAT